MAGHSKWANIKHKKERSDAKKGKIFSRLVKEIISAVKQGGGDPKTNSKLRLVIQKAKSANVPMENIEKNIKKASQNDQQDYVEVTYELYGHGGIGLVVEAMTDNRNRTASEMRIATHKKGGTIASPGSVLYNFDRKGIIEIQKKDHEEEEVFLVASELGAEDFEVLDAGFLVVTSAAHLFAVKEGLEQREIICCEAGVEMLPKSTIVCDPKDEEANLELIAYLEALDDVDVVVHNMEISNEKEN